MVKIRTYGPKPCVKCGETISAPRGPQRYCEPCGSTCSIQGCVNQVRTKGLCVTHASQKFAVTALPPINGKCGVEGCGRDLKQKGMCTLHYGRAYHKGDIGAVAPRATKPKGVPCSVEGCAEMSKARGYCATHYQRWRTRGDAGGAELEIAPAGSGYLAENGYRYVFVDGKSVLEHRIVLEQKLARKLIPGENAHHLDGNRSNNDPRNIELWTTQQPAGQRVTDRVKAAISILRQYPELAADEGVRIINLESQEATDLLMNDKEFMSICSDLGFGA